MAYTSEYAQKAMSKANGGGKKKKKGTGTPAPKKGAGTPTAKKGAGTPTAKKGAGAKERVGDTSRPDRKYYEELKMKMTKTK